MTVDECKAKTTSTQFVDWQVKFADDERKKWTETTKWEHYLAELRGGLAELTYYMRGIYMGLGGKPRPHDFAGHNYVMHYTYRTDDSDLPKKPKSSEEPELTEEEVKQRIAASKSCWFGLVGLTEEVV
jgi:hypothetical protein